MKGGHGGDIYSAKNNIYSDTIYDFSANINPLGMPEKIKTAIIDAIPTYAAYPDPHCRELRRALAEKCGVSDAQCCFGNGAADIIYRIALAFKPNRALIPAPTFSEYEDALDSVGCAIDRFVCVRERGFALSEAFVDNISLSTDIIFICNPNNPTGALTSRALLQKIIKRAEDVGALVVVDECFMDFVDEEESYSLLSVLSEHPNLIILGAFTKMYAMAGIRLGYMLSGNEKLVSSVAAAGQPWSVSAVAVACGLAAMKLIDYPKKTRRCIAHERARLVMELEKLGFTVFPPTANYIFLFSPDSSFAEKLEQCGILARRCDNYLGLDSHYFRLAVRTTQENEYLVKCLNRIYGGAL